MNEIELGICKSLLAEILAHSPEVTFSVDHACAPPRVIAEIISPRPLFQPGQGFCGGRSLWFCKVEDKPTLREALAVIVDSLRKHDGRPSLDQQASDEVARYDAAKLLEITDRCPRCGNKQGFKITRSCDVVISWEFGEMLSHRPASTQGLQPGELGRCCGCGGLVRCTAPDECSHCGHVGSHAADCPKAPEPEECAICGETGGEHNSRCFNLGKK